MNDINFTEKEREQIDRYLEMLISKNKVLNLTRITDYDEMWVKHILDSASVLPILDEIGTKKIVDVGTGAGFPGVIIKIMRPDIEVVLLDSLKKRLVFLDEVIEELGLKGITTAHERAEEACNPNRKDGYREMFDTSIARAVARLNTLIEYNLPFVKPGGHMIAMKGPGVKEELDEIKNGLNTLGGKVKKTHSFSLENGDERNIVVIEKIKSTPKKYPRTGNKPKTQPL